VHVGVGDAVGAQQPQLGGEGGIVGDDRAAVADPAEVLGGVEAVGRGDRPDAVRARGRLRGVLEHGQAEVGMVAGRP